MDEFENGTRRHATLEYVDADNALHRAMDLLRAQERKANPGVCHRRFLTVGNRLPSLESQGVVHSGLHGRPDFGQSVSEGTSAGTRKGIGGVVHSGRHGRPDFGQLVSEGTSAGTRKGIGSVVHSGRHGRPDFGQLVSEGTSAGTRKGIGGVVHSGLHGRPDFGQLVSERTPAGTRKDIGDVPEDESELNERDDGLMVDGNGIAHAAISIKVGRQRANRPRST
jgi:hypothetical protein